MCTELWKSGNVDKWRAALNAAADRVKDQGKEGHFELDK